MTTRPDDCPLCGNWIDPEEVVLETFPTSDPHLLRVHRICRVERRVAMILDLRDSLTTLQAQQHQTGIRLGNLENDVRGIRLGNLKNDVRGLSR